MIAIWVLVRVLRSIIECRYPLSKGRGCPFTDILFFFKISQNTEGVYFFILLLSDYFLRCALTQPSRVLPSKAEYTCRIDLAALFLNSLFRSSLIFFGEVNYFLIFIESYSNHTCHPTNLNMFRFLVALRKNKASCF